MTAARRRRREAPRGRFIVVTGLSGAGKSQAIRALEDLGYFCVDNLPTQLIPTLANLSKRGSADLPKVALVIDVREGSFLRDFPRVWKRLKATPGLDPLLDLPRGQPRHAGAALQRDPAAASAGSRPVRRRGAAVRAAADAEDPRAGRRDRRHDAPDGAPAARAVPGLLRSAQPAAEAGGHAAQLRVQARPAGRRRPGLRRAVPAEPALRRSAAPEDRTRPRRRQIPRASAADRGVSRRGCATCCCSWCRSTCTKARAT